MNPREELLSRSRLGPSGATLLYRTIWSVAIGHRFPPPAGSTGWDRAAVTETAHDFLQDERGSRRLLDVALRSVDEESFARLLDAAVLNFLRDIARGTDFGKLILRVKEILRSEACFEAVPGSPERWTLAGGATAPGTAASAADLSSAIAGIPVVVPRWSSERRDAPLADRPSFVLLVTELLAVAGGSLTAVDLAHTLTSRLDHRRMPLATSLDVMERLAEPATDLDPAVRTAAGIHAVAIFDSLSDRERLLVPNLDRNVRELASLIGTGKTQAAHVRHRLLDRLRHELGDDDADHVAGALCDLCNAWAERRTGSQGCDVL